MNPLRLFRPDSEPERTEALTVRDVFRHYCAHAAAKQLHSVHAARNRDYAFRLFSEIHGGLPAEDLKPFHLTDWIDANPRWKSTATRRAQFNFVRSAFMWAASQERISRNPCGKNPYCEAERRPDMPEDVIELLQRVGNKPFEMAVRWLRLTGCRVGELCQATWSDVDLERGLWRIERHKTRKQTGKAKIVALVTGAIELLKSAAAAQSAPTTPPNPLGITPVVHALNVPASTQVIFTNTRGRPWTQAALTQTVYDLRRRRLIPRGFCLHGIRHRAASAAIAAGASIKLVAQQLGHSTVRTTETYYADLSGAIDQIRDAFGKGIPLK